MSQMKQRGISIGETLWTRAKKVQEWLASIGDRRSLSQMVRDGLEREVAYLEARRDDWEKGEEVDVR